jgi:hypothetical protein
VRSECWEAGREEPLGIWGGETRHHRPHVTREERVFLAV